MTYRCIYPRCPESCSQCNHAIPEREPAMTITADEISERLDEVSDLFGPEGWEKFRRKPEGRALIDLVHDCSVAVEAFEDAAKQRVPKHQQAVADMAARLICPGSLEPLPDRARKAGAA